jgi:hypothetical protein
MARGDTAEKDGGLGATGRLCAAEAVANPLTWHKIAPSYAPGAPPPCPHRPAVPRLARPSAPPARMRISPRVQPARQQSTEAIVSRPRRHFDSFGRHPRPHLPRGARVARGDIPVLIEKGARQRASHPLGALLWHPDGEDPNGWGRAGRRWSASEKGVRLAQKVQVGPSIPVGTQR